MERGDTNQATTQTDVNTCVSVPESRINSQDKLVSCYCDRDREQTNIDKQTRPPPCAGFYTRKVDSGNESERIKETLHSILINI